MKEELAVREIAEDVGKGKAGERKTGEREDRREEGPWVGEVVECLG